MRHRWLLPVALVTLVGHFAGAFLAGGFVLFFLLFLLLLAVLFCAGGIACPAAVGDCWSGG